MLGLRWAERLGGKTSKHPLSDGAAAAALLQELPFGSPAKVVAESGAWLESVEAETSFTRAHRLHVVSLIDEATRPSVDELVLRYAGIGIAAPGQAADWRALMSYLDRLGAAYRAVIHGLEEPRAASLGASVPVALCRLTRTLACSMKVSWMRYLPPDRASWEGLVQAYRTAQAHDCADTLVMAYPTDAGRTCALHEFTVAAMFAAASPESLNPRRVELVHRIASSCRAAFTVGLGNQDGWKHYLMNLDQPGAPARVPEQLAAGEAWMYFHAEKVRAHLQALLEASRNAPGGITDEQFGAEFASSEKQHAIEHVLRFWDDSPPARREPRMRINTKVQVEFGVQGVREALESAEAHTVTKVAIVMEGLAPGETQAEAGREAVAPIAWTLTDYSARGIGIRCPRRLERLRIGSVIGVRLERSDKWCVAIVRRLRTDARNQTDVGAEVLTKAAELVTLEGLASAGTVSGLNGGGSLVRSRALLLPEDSQHHIRGSLLFEPGTNVPGQTFVLQQGDSTRRVRLHEAQEILDGWERVEFDWVD